MEGGRHSLLVVANADLRYEHTSRLGPLTALLLTYNLFGDSFFEASCRLGAGNAVMDMRRDCFHRLIPPMVVDLVEALSDRFLDKMGV